MPAVAVSGESCLWLGALKDLLIGLKKTIAMLTLSQ